MPIGKIIPGFQVSPQDEDLLEVNFIPNKNGYLEVVRIEDHVRHRIGLHSIIALRKYARAGERDQSVVVDFKDRDRRNFRRDNIRLISGQANAYNNPRTDHCGVTWNAVRKKWRTRVTMDGKTVYLGNYELESEAWAAVDAFKRSKEFRDWYEELFLDLGSQ